MNLLYINDLRSLPNFGCRTTGSALEEMLKKKHTLVRRDGLETIYNSGWDFMSRDCYKVGGIIPEKYYKYFWSKRFSKTSLFRKLRRIDAAMGALHDYISENIEQSVDRFHRFKQNYPVLADLESQMEQSDGVAINGEGTLIFGNPTKRDALYLLFIIALARTKNKPVFLMNAMITQDPYGGASDAMLEQVADLLRYCAVIAARESGSLDFVQRELGCTSGRLIPDALFTWGEKILQAAEAVKLAPELALSYGLTIDSGTLNFREPYICVSTSSSAWRSEKETGVGLVRLATALKTTGLRVYFLSTCAGDNLLGEAAKEAKVVHIPQNLPVLAGAGIIAGASVYVSGRYHPAIMAGAGGVPTVFLSSNSHKDQHSATSIGI